MKSVSPFKDRPRNLNLSVFSCTAFMIENITNFLNGKASLTQGRFAGWPWAVIRPGLPRIRTCPIKASGSSRQGLPDRGAIRGRYGKPAARYEALGGVPDHGPLTCTSLPSAGSPQARCPNFDGTMKMSDFLPSFSPRFVSFAWRYHYRASVFVSPARPDAGLGPGVFGCGNSQPHVIDVETTGSLRFLGDPTVPMPCSQTPAGPPHQAITVVRRGPRIAKPRGLPRLAKFRGSIAGPQHSLSTLRRLRCRSSTQDSLPGAGQALPCGLSNRRVSRKVSELQSLPPFPSFLTQLANWQEVRLISSLIYDRNYCIANVLWIFSNLSKRSKNGRVLIPPFLARLW